MPGRGRPGASQEEKEEGEKGSSRGAGFASQPQPLAAQMAVPLDWPTWADMSAVDLPVPWVVMVPWRMEEGKSEEAYITHGKDEGNIICHATPRHILVVGGVRWPVSRHAVRTVIHEVWEDALRTGSVQRESLGMATWFRAVPIGRSTGTDQSGRDLLESLDKAGSTAAGSAAGSSCPSSGAAELDMPAEPTSDSLSVAAPHEDSAPASSPRGQKRQHPLASEGETEHAVVGDVCGCSGNCGRQNCKRGLNRRRTSRGQFPLCTNRPSGGNLCELCQCQMHSCTRARSKRIEGGRWCLEHGRLFLHQGHRRHVTAHGEQRSERCWDDNLRFVAQFGFVLRYFTPEAFTTGQDFISKCLGLPPVVDASALLQAGSPAIGAKVAGSPAADFGSLSPARPDLVGPSVSKRARVVWAFLGHAMKWPPAVRYWEEILQEEQPVTATAIVKGLEEVLRKCSGERWKEMFEAMNVGIDYAVGGLTVLCTQLGMLEKVSGGSSDEDILLGCHLARFTLITSSPDAAAIVDYMLTTAPTLVHPHDQASAMKYLNDIRTFARGVRSFRTASTRGLTGGRSPDDYSVRSLLRLILTTIMESDTYMDNLAYRDIEDCLPDRKGHLTPLRGTLVKEMRALFDTLPSLVGMWACLAGSINPPLGQVLAVTDGQAMEWFTKAEMSISQGMRGRPGLRQLADEWVAARDC